MQTLNSASEKIKIKNKKLLRGHLVHGNAECWRSAAFLSLLRRAVLIAENDNSYSCT